MRYLLRRLLTGERIKKLNKLTALQGALWVALCVLYLTCAFFCTSFEGAARVALGCVFGFLTVAAAGTAAYFGISSSYVICKLLNAEGQTGGERGELILKACSFYAGKPGRKITALKAAAALLFIGGAAVLFCYSIGANLAYAVALGVATATNGGALACLLAATYYETDASALPEETYTALPRRPRAPLPARGLVLSHQEKFLCDGGDVREYRKLTTDGMFAVTVAIVLCAAFSLALCLGVQNAEEVAFASALGLDVLNIFFILAAVAIYYEIRKRAVYARNKKLLALCGDETRGELQRIYEKFQRVTNIVFAAVAAVGTLAGFLIGLFGTEERTAFAMLCGGGMAAGVFFFISALIGFIVYTVLYIRYDKKAIPLEERAEDEDVFTAEDGV